jgi:hypothetical protein
LSGVFACVMGHGLQRGDESNLHSDM